MRILIIEDEKAIAEPIGQSLERRAFAVDLAFDGRTGYTMASNNAYDCIVLDLNLPEVDGLTVAQRLRHAEINTPILMLTARGTQDDILEGFAAGTDDYLVKPFDLRELIYRVQALVRRNSHTAAPELKHADIQVDTQAVRVYKAGEEVQLAAKEYGILEYLLRHKGRVVSQEELLEHVWNEQIDTLSQTVRTTMKTLRQKIDKDKAIIHTRTGKGYIIE